MDLKCPCGAVTVRIEGEPLVQFYCHCKDCQRAHGAAYVPESIYPAPAVTIVGETTTWMAARTPRYSCAKCGARLVADVLEAGLRGVPAALLPADAFSPVMHIHCESARLPVKDDLPHYKTMPAAFGGEDAVVDW
jgi:hypothetical protein